MSATNELSQAIAYADSHNLLLETIIAPASPDDKRVKAAKKCLNISWSRVEGSHDRVATVQHRHEGPSKADASKLTDGSKPSSPTI